MWLEWQQERDDEKHESTFEFAALVGVVRVNGSRDDTFIATLGQSPYATDYAAKTREDLIKYANDFCRQATAPPSPGLQEILAMTPDPSAEKYFGTLAVTTYCPSAAPVLTNFFN